ncbi:MAG: exodeoxyribonuclease I [Gammaproteobacteria bacterium]
MSQQKTLYWYDLETFGIDSKRDRISQFAGIRTDENLNIIGDPLTIYCQLSEEVLPEPISCLVTGITPDTVNEKGLKEHEFVKAIYQEFSTPNTCVVGYNNLRFDDEFMRYAFYRNFFDPYEREWKNGNSRWDIIDMVRATHALRPEGINWPKDDEGTTRFKLELLTKENGIEHSMAHDAMSDVYATIEMARLIKSKQPKLYDYVYSNKSKQKLAKMLNIRDMTPVIHVSSRYTAAKSCMAIVAPIAMHPINKNAYIVYDLSEDPTPLIELGVEGIKKRLFTPTDQLPEGVSRIPIKAVHINKCPIIAPLSTLDSASSKRLNVKLDLCLKNLMTLKQSRKISDKLRSVFAKPEYESNDDPEFKLYDGFFNDNDKQSFSAIRESSPEKLKNQQFTFSDNRLPELLIRYKARNFPESLSDAEKLQWEEYQNHRLFTDTGAHALTIPMLREKIETIKSEGTEFTERLHVLDELLEYVDKLEQKYSTALA